MHLLGNARGLARRRAGQVTMPIPRGTREQGRAGGSSHVPVAGGGEQLRHQVLGQTPWIDLGGGGSEFAAAKA